MIQLGADCARKDFCLTDFCGFVGCRVRILLPMNFCGNLSSLATDMAVPDACSIEGKSCRDASTADYFDHRRVRLVALVHRLFPDIDWLIAAGLVSAAWRFCISTGLPESIVTGPFLIASGIAWALHDRWHVTWFVLIPTLLILLGC